MDRRSISAFFGSLKKERPLPGNLYKPILKIDVPLGRFLHIPNGRFGKLLCNCGKNP